MLNSKAWCWIGFSDSSCHPVYVPQWKATMLQGGTGVHMTVGCTGPRAGWSWYTHLCMEILTGLAVHRLLQVSLLWPKVFNSEDPLPIFKLTLTLPLLCKIWGLTRDNREPKAGRETPHRPFSLNLANGGFWNCCFGASNGWDTRFRRYFFAPSLKG